MSVEEKPYEGHFVLQIELAHIKGPSVVDPAESAILFSDPERFQINGIRPHFKRGVESLVPDEEGTWTLAEDSPRVGGFVKHDGFWTIELHNLTDESFEALGINEDVWMEDSTRDIVILPISRLEITWTQPRDEPAPDGWLEDKSA